MAKGSGVELGGGATLSHAQGADCRIPADAALDTGTPYTPTCGASSVLLPDLTHWGMVPLSDRWALGWQVAAGAGSPGLAGGVVGRYDLSKRERLLIGPQVELGFAWGALGLPVSAQVGERVWLYAHPSVGYRINGLARVPVGLGVPIGKRLRLDLETGVAGPITSGIYTRYDGVTGLRTWFSVGLSTRVGG